MDRADKFIGVSVWGTFAVAYILSNCYRDGSFVTLWMFFASISFLILALIYPLLNRKKDKKKREEMYW